MQKAKVYNIADSNIAMLGSDLEKEVKKAAADTEPAWDNAGKELGIQIWRIEKFQVVSWPKEEYGSFFDGDSYIVLHTWKKPDAPKLYWDVYFWLGKYTSQDEAGTAAYKTVELDDKLGGDPVQHREVMGYESDGFMKLFKGEIKLLSGGVDTGFRHVEPESYTARLLHLKGRGRKIRVTQVEMRADSMNSGDCFILDNGLTIYQWNGKSAGPMEKNKAPEMSRALDDERAGKAEVVVLEESMSGEDSDTFFGFLEGDASNVKSAEEGGDDAEAALKGDKRLFQLSDASGEMTFTEIDAVSRDSFKSEDVFIFDTGAHVFAWIGNGASKDERRNALGYAQSYLTKYNRPEFMPISRIFEDGENEVFNAALS
jgi:gelsolin